MALGQTALMEDNHNLITFMRVASVMEDNNLGVGFRVQGKPDGARVAGEQYGRARVWDSGFRAESVKSPVRAYIC